MRHVDLLRIFVASPSDVRKERACVRDVVDDANGLLPTNHPVQFKAIGFETDVYSDIGEDVQDVINNQVNDDYEVFLGIMWTRLGTPTKRAPSGTEEEFNRALSRRRSSGDFPVISFYIKDAAPPARGIDADQIEKVKLFRKRLQDVGVYYKPFPKAEAFRYILLRDLVRIAHAYASSRHTLDELRSDERREYEIFLSEYAPTASSVDIPLNDSARDALADFSLYNAQYRSALNELTSYANDMRDAVLASNNAVKAKTGELRGLIKSGRIDNETTGRVFNKIGDQYGAVAAKLRDGLPAFVSSIRQAVNGLFGMIRVIPDFRPLADTAKHELSEQTKDMVTNLEECRLQMIGYRDVVASLPRKTNHYNRSRKALVNVIDVTNEQYLIAIYMFRAFNENLV